MTSFADPLAQVKWQLPGYVFVDTIYQGSRTRVYRAVARATQQPVVIKVLAQEYPSFRELVQFRNQYTVAKNLSIADIVRPLSLEPCGNGYGLVMEDCGGIDLEQYAQKYDLALAEILDIGLHLTEILGDLHQHRIIHKDIKPANILIHPNSKQIKLIDFSIASLLPKETLSIQSPQRLEGTLAYLAPEQTGRMNRVIDYRADFYALGVTLYELLTSRLPFTSTDPLTLIHCHMAQIPAAVDQVNPEVPTMVAAIVAKLMAKNAEDRYQSASGLKHDLAQCLTQWHKQGEIAIFTLGQRDISDRFLVPEKLYGRATEVQTLLEAFDRVSEGTSQMMLVEGFSGVGKTAVINEVHKPIVAKRGYFIKGKFDQFNRNIPFSAFVQAFRSLMGQLLGESNAELANWKAKILKAVGENGQVLIEVIPELAHIIGPQPTASELSGSAAQNRFNFLFSEFMRVSTTKDSPLVIFLDDLQWVDSASLNLLNLLMAESEVGHLLVLGAYRDNEVFPAHPLMQTLDEVRKTGANLCTLTLEPLATTDINQLVADTLLCSTEVAAPLSQLIYQKTQGNPFFTTQFLQGLYGDGWITFDSALGCWQCDLVQVRQLALTDDVVEFMVGQLRKLPEATQAVLKLAACIGNQFDLATLAVVCEASQNQVATDLWRSLQAGFVVPQSETYKFFQGEGVGLVPDETSSIAAGYRFLHDRVQQAAYELIDETQKQQTHLTVGQLLLQDTPDSQLDERLFAIVNQLNLGARLLTEPAQQRELAGLNLRSGLKAKAAVAYSAAVAYCRQGIDLLGRDRWLDPAELTLDLYNAAAEAACLNCNYPAMAQWIAEIFEHVPTLLAQIPAYEVKIQAEIAQNQLKAAVQTGLGVLERLGVHLPSTPGPQDIGQGFATTAFHLEGKSPEDLLTLVEMTAAEHLAALKMLAGIWGAAFAIAPNLMPLIVLEMVNLSVRYGNAPISAFAYVLYGVLLCGSENFQQGYEFGEVALKLLNRFNTQSFKAKILFLIGTHITIWQDSVQATLSTFKKAYQVGLETGDLEFAALPAAIGAYYGYLAGQHLADVKREFVAYTQAMEQIQQTYYLNFLHIWHQAVTNLLEAADQPQRLVGDICDGEALLAQFQKDNATTPMAYIYINQLMLNYLFGQYAVAVEVSPLADEYAQMVPATLLIPIANFYGSLAKLAHYPQVAAPNQLPWLEEVRQHQHQLQRWCRHAPMNYQHKYDLVEAELHRLAGEQLAAIDAYEHAIWGAKTNGYLQEEALANELAAKFYLDCDKNKIAEGYMQEAYYSYARWGAKAKVADLEARYPRLLRPILQSSAASGEVLHTLTSIAAPKISVDSNTRTSSIYSGTRTSSNNISLNQTIDFVSVLRASQTLSSTIQLDKLLRQLTQIILQNSGGERCALVLPDETGECQVRAITTPNETQLCADPLTHSPNVPVKFIRYIKNTQEVVVIDNLDTHLPVVDDYLRQQQPKSLLCMPILNQGRLIGILYLENCLTSGVFTEERILVLNFLCTQAAISLENARLYNQVQQALNDLQQMQLQLVQSEKMSALGNLVAGVAHEINNPVGCIIGNVGAAQHYISDLFGLLELYARQFPNPGSDIENELETVELDYVREDLPQLIRAMEDSGERIKSISRSLRTFSRADTETKQPFNLHEGIDSTVLILNHRLKANAHRPAIEVVTDYGNIPYIDCFSGQLNQVFMNILANAIDALDEASQTRSFTEIEANPQRITIRTGVENNWVQVAISDNGPGIPNEIKARIFEHLFTTKGVGKGTGLGLAIAHQIVVETHGGSLELHSEVAQGAEFCIRLPL
ncbi:MAG: AAA family ATPase [Cyanobacteria bacterium P01_D01_bin.56]